MAKDCTAICREDCPHYEQHGCVPQLCASAVFVFGAWTCRRKPLVLVADELDGTAPNK